tara:strand:- start:1256 stop:1417 length:162 start_codon:yes stop_codon:yes gene_type:complete
MEKLYLGVASLFIIFALYYFIIDAYNVLYKIYYDSEYLARIINKYNEFVGKYF